MTREGAEAYVEAEDLWEQFVEKGSTICGLCGNWGVIDTRPYLRSPAGHRCGVLRYCICPNGRSHKREGTNLELLALNMKHAVPGARGGSWNGGMPVIE